MSADALLPTAILLGFFVLCAGCYGLFYAFGRLRDNRKMMAVSFSFYAVQGVITGLLLLFSPLTVGWKVFLLLSFFVYAAIPPMTWRQLELTHQTLGHES